MSIAGRRRCRDRLCVDCADLRTSIADARTALCLAKGTAFDDVDPASGYDHSARAYGNVRRSWVSVYTTNAVTDWAVAGIEEARSSWARIRPAEASGDDWLTAAADAHRAYWAGVGRLCNSEACTVCYPLATVPAV
jgi:hypothetical protein